MEKPHKYFVHFRMVLCLILLFFCFSSASAQDKIVQLKGDTISASITKMTADTIWFSYPENTDSVIQLSTSYVRKIIYHDGREEQLEHLSKIKNNTMFMPNKNELYVYGNRYVLNGITIPHANLETIYVPLKDSLLNDLYFRGMNMKQGSRILKFAPIPMGAVGYGLVVFSEIPTNKSLTGFNHDQPKYGNHNLIIPGIILMGSALISGIGGIITHRAYKRLLNKSAIRYNEIIRKHELN